jgi:hypothetical protein
MSSIRWLGAAALLFVGAVPLAGQARPAPAAADEPYVVDYYYKARWGFADEFIRLFRKNHYPVLKREMEKGRILSITAAAPRYHATEEGRWDYRVTLVFRNLEAAFAEALSEAEMRALYPDRETFQREEQRRFEILLAHWDVPVRSVELAGRP